MGQVQRNIATPWRQRHKGYRRPRWGATTTSCNHLARVMPATQWPPGALETPCPVSHACCRRASRRRSWNGTTWTDLHVATRWRHRTSLRMYIRSCAGGQRYRSGTRANQRSKIDTYICRNVESIDFSGWLLGASPRRLRMERAARRGAARRVPLSTKILRGEQAVPVTMATPCLIGTTMPARFNPFTPGRL